MTNLFAEALPEEIKEIFTEPKSPKRIDIIGQNGNDGLHYEPNSFAIQTLFGYGWDYIGHDDDGLRSTYKTETEAQTEIDELVEFTHTPGDEWRVAPYNPHEDDDCARF